MASQVALALVLLTGAGLLLRSFVAVRAIDPGFAPDRLASFVVSVAGTAEAAPGRRAAFYDQVLGQVRAVPGVDADAAINHMPLVGDLWGVPFDLEGRPTPPRGHMPTATFRVVSAGYFETMGIHVLAGRSFEVSDRAGAQPVLIVNARLAADSWPGASAVGRHVRVRFGFDSAGGDSPWRTIIGVSANTVRGDLHDAPEPELFVPLAQSPAYLAADDAHLEAMTIVVRTTGRPAPLVPAFRQAVRGISAEVPLSDVFILSDVVDEAADGTRFTLVLLGAFAAVALVLASLGIVGVMHHEVSGRRRELGIRLALGASRGRLVADLARDGLFSTGIGLLLGLAGSYLMRGALSSLLFGVRPFDTRIVSLVAATMALAAVASCLGPVLRASRRPTASDLR